ncbi:MAG: hypothetical protein ACSLE0_16850 [Chitinophagaceae bacterium]
MHNDSWHWGMGLGMGWSMWLIPVLIIGVVVFVILRYRRNR